MATGLGLIVGGLYYVSDRRDTFPISLPGCPGGTHWGGEEPEHPKCIYYTVKSITGDKAEVEPCTGKGYFQRNPESATTRTAKVSDLLAHSTLVSMPEMPLHVVNERDRMVAWVAQHYPGVPSSEVEAFFVKLAFSVPSV